MTKGQAAKRRSLGTRLRASEARRRKLVVELMRRSAEAVEAREEARRLRRAIETHRDHTGHNLCWLNDLRLWKTLGDGKPVYPRETVPPEDEFLTGCRAYYASRFACGDRRHRHKRPKLVIEPY